MKTYPEQQCVECDAWFTPVKHGNETICSDQCRRDRSYRMTKEHRIRTRGEDNDQFLYPHWMGDAGPKTVAWVLERREWLHQEHREALYVLDELLRNHTPVGSPYVREPLFAHEMADLELQARIAKHKEFMRKARINRNRYKKRWEAT